MKIDPTETEIRGHWALRDGIVVGDENCSRIDWLVQNRLKEAGRCDGGWAVLYSDPTDGRFWELTYPRSDMHGGGPPLLTLISTETARKKYPQKTG